jgi:hypothetical protein
MPFPDTPFLRPHVNGKFLTILLRAIPTTKLSSKSESHALPVENGRKPIHNLQPFLLKRLSRICSEFLYGDQKNTVSEAKLSYGMDP